jgi:hypothetical protein
MAVNFGSPPRQSSQVVKSPQQVQEEFQAAQRAYEAQRAALEWQRQNIATPEEYAQQQTTAHANSGAFDEFFKQQAAYNPIWNTKEQQDWYRQEYARDVAPTILAGGNNDSDKAYISQFEGLNGVQEYDPAKVASGIENQLAALTSDFQQQKSAFDAFTANQTRQQQAYNQQAGGGFAGGIIDASYPDPFSNQISGQSFGGLGGLGGIPSDPSLPNVSMPWAQPWGTPGFGQPGQGNSVGAYSPTGNQQQNGQQGSQWGGVFGAKNPWSPA